MPPKIYMYTTHSNPHPYSVANHSPCRNNSDKNLDNFLESAQNHRTFAASSYINNLSFI